MEITSMSSRGQVVIPQSLRSRMGIQEGEKFIVIGDDDTIVLKKVPEPSFEGIGKLLKETREFAKQTGLKPSDVRKAIQQVRKQNANSA
ncbi:AbrB/MazE/SpoVT family DNA-binding domain-containing protein [Candidatus Woesearchaeota archaeon]|nr:AbrB/MazE/SpoVT family DNA-binding domain-containing protein [Candidatus Woesearchaeota archaeon]